MSTAVPPPLRPPAHQVSPRAVHWWRVQTLITTMFLVTPQVVVLVVAGEDGPGWLAATAAVTTAFLLVYAVALPPILFRLNRWEITDEAVYTLSGWLVREWRIAPISRVQTVDTARGPLQQLFKLASVTVTTASSRGPVTIKGLDAQDAAELARTLTAATQATAGDAT